MMVTATPIISHHRDRPLSRRNGSEIDAASLREQLVHGRRRARSNAGVLAQHRIDAGGAIA